MAFVLSLAVLRKRRRTRPEIGLTPRRGRCPASPVFARFSAADFGTAEGRDGDLNIQEDGRRKLAAVAARATGSRNTQYFREAATQQFLREISHSYGSLSADEQSSMCRAIQEWQKLQQQSKELAAHLGRQPEDEEVAEAQGLSVEVLRERRIYGQAARETMVATNLLLVVKVASRLKPVGGLDSADLVMDGVIGLVQAVDKWNPSLGAAFTTFAWTVINASIVRAAYNTANLVRVPEYRLKEYFRMRRTVVELRDSHQGRSPSTEQIAVAMNVTLKELHVLQSCSETLNIGSLDIDVSSSADLPAQKLSDILPSEEESPMDRLNVDLTVAHVRKVLGNNLTGKQLEAVILRFGMDGGDAKSYREIGRALGVSYVRAHGLVRSAIAFLQRDSQARSALAEVRNDLYLAAK